VVLFSAYLGRLPVAFWFIVLATATAAWCAGATSLESFTAARILNGFFSTVMQVAGLMFIQDIFFFHERARKINIWAYVSSFSPHFPPISPSFPVTLTALAAAITMSKRLKLMKYFPRG
jgi:MFS family permease